MLLFLLLTAPAWGQGCAMCYTSAQGATKNSQQAMNRAVTILLIPPVGIMTLLVGFAFYYNGRLANGQPDSPSGQRRQREEAEGSGRA